MRKGMVLASPELHPEAVWEFDASISILTHSTTIQPRYQAVIHCEIIRQVFFIIVRMLIHVFSPFLALKVTSVQW